jgi:hypothetical protein
LICLLIRISCQLKTGYKIKRVKNKGNWLNGQLKPG